MSKLKDEAIKLKQNIEASDYKKFIITLNKGWEEKQKTSKFIVDRNINKILINLKKKGADSVKISGAGGGGFFFILTKLPLPRIFLIVAKNFFARLIFNFR